MRLPVFQTLIGQGDTFSAAILDQTGSNLLVISRQTGQVSEHTLDAGRSAEIATFSAGLSGAAPSGAAVLDDDRVWLWEGFQGRGVLLGDEALVPRAVGENLLTVSAVFQIDGAVLINPFGGHSLALMHEFSNGTFAELDRLDDSPKQSVAGLVDRVSVNVAGQDFIVTAAQTGGLTSLTAQGGNLALIDHLGPKDGLFVDGLTALETVEVDGVDYILALSAANTLVSVRINDHGVFFVEDEIWDSLSTRFAGAQAMDMIAVAGRNFAVIGGTDLGLSFVEVLPGGGVFHHGVMAQTLDWNIGAITDIQVISVGGEAQIFAGGATGGIAQFNWSLDTIGARVSGTDGSDNIRGYWQDDLLIGGAGDDLLMGRAGQDVLIDGAGQDTLNGEDGADVFVFVADGQRDRINGFLQGEDRIHLQDWGRIHHHSALTIESTDFGATIAWGDEWIDVYSKNGKPIEVADWGADDFVF